MISGCLTGPHLSFAVTGASFVVFNGALKASSGFIAKSSIVEGNAITHHIRTLPQVIILKTFNHDAVPLHL